MSALERKLDQCNLVLLQAVRRRAQEESLSVFLVGGPVRDVLLDAPIKDLDFVVEGDAPRLAQELAGEVDGEVVSHPQFGTATVILPQCRVDVVTARREVYPEPGALPVVSPSTISDDLARRDFTLNALALPLHEASPQVFDPHRGLSDLEQGVVRVLHLDSFIDDPTRILRAVRYEQRLGFMMESGTLQQLQNALSRRVISAVSGDRIRHELERIFDEPETYPILKRAGELGILAAVHPALAGGDAFDRLSQRSQTPTPAGLEAGPLVWLAALVYPLSLEEGEGVIRRLNLSNAWAQVVRDTITLRLQEGHLAVPSLAPSEVYHLLHRRCLPSLEAVARITGNPAAAERLELYRRELRAVAPALRGDDLLAMGVPSGPAVGRALRLLLDARLDGRVANEAQERALVAELLATEGGQANHDG